MVKSSVLSRNQFLERLRIEQRRSDRSKAPVSVVLFSFKQEVGGAFEHIAGLLPSLQKNTRETDGIGWVDRNVIGLLLPDTDARGAESCVLKIRNGHGRLPYSLVQGTYPDEVFQKLLSENGIQPDLFPLYTMEPRHFSKGQFLLKRGLDLLGSIVGITLLAPLMAVTAIAIKGTSPGPVIFRQTRVGHRGERFSFYKFRSMAWGTDDQIHRKYVSELIAGNHEEVNQGDGEKPLYKIKSDPRVTRVGKIIRKLSIDELPQLYNVMKGEMSLVGPRPPLPYEVEKYSPWHLRRILDVRPGITGLWQVEGRSKTTFDDMVRLDLRYVQHFSLYLDLKIMIKTVKAVLRPTGAM